MTISEATLACQIGLAQSTNTIRDSHILLAHIMQSTVTELLAIDPARELTPSQTVDLQQSLELLAAGTPFDYVTGFSAFHGRDFKVSQDVLIPRPETEQLVQLILDNPLFIKANHILDIGIGSGCVSVTLFAEAKARGKETITLTSVDKSAAALEITRKNMQNLLGTEFHSVVQHASYLSLDGKIQLFNTSAKDISPTIIPDIIVSNPPYVTDKEMAMLDESVAKFEPHIALSGGDDGLDVCREILSYIRKLPQAPALFLELSPTTVQGAKALFSEMYNYQEVIKDNFGRERFLISRNQ